MRVFVYGTLCSGEHNHSYISENLVRSLGVFKTVEKYYMIRNKGYSFPYLIPSGLLDLKEEPIKITGEVYEITKEGLDRIDMLEGVPDHYTRDVITVENEEGKAQAFIYLMKDKAYLDVIQNEFGKWFLHCKTGDWKQEDHSKH